MTSYTEVLDELRKISFKDDRIKNFLFELLEYESNGGSHWKREYLELIDKFILNEEKNEIREN